MAKKTALNAVVETSATPIEVTEPILNSPFCEPEQYWFLREGEPAEKRSGRRPSFVYPPRTQKEPWDLGDRTLKPSKEYQRGYELALVAAIRDQMKLWRDVGRPGITRTTTFDEHASLRFNREANDEEAFVILEVGFFGGFKNKSLGDGAVLRPKDESYRLFFSVDRRRFGSDDERLRRLTDVLQIEGVVAGKAYNWALAEHFQHADDEGRAL